MFHVCVVGLFDYSELYIAIWRALSEINEEAIPLIYACIPRAMHNVIRPDFLFSFYLQDFCAPKKKKSREIVINSNSALLEVIFRCRMVSFQSLL